MPDEGVARNQRPEVPTQGPSRVLRVNPPDCKRLFSRWAALLTIVLRRTVFLPSLLAVNKTACRNLIVGRLPHIGGAVLRPG